jgi:apolipoprotein D and lipocalin family protein
MQLMVRNIQIVVFAFILSGCVGLPDGIQPVEQFELNRYLGQWYEIARLDHSFERGLDKVTAEYTLRADGGVKVINRGLSSTDNEWKEAEGKAYFVRDADEGYFKVSFFGPFYGAYVIFELDKEQYQYAFIAGNDRSYLWLLARTPRVSDELIQRFIKRAKELGFATDNLIYVKQN